LGRALRLIEVAADAGADAVKFQTFKAARMYPRSAGESDYLRMATPIYEIIRAMEMPEDWVPRLAEHAHANGIEFLSSAFDESGADLLHRHVPAFKVASYEITHVPLLRHLARQGKPIIMSTGTASLVEVQAAVAVLREAGADEIVLMQCTASYPTPFDAVNARAIVTLREATGLPVGLSDHSRDPIVAPVVAVALGACAIEKHFTTSNALPGPDHRFAIEPDELRQMVRRIREAEAALGTGRKEVLPVEEELRSFARRSVFTTRPVGRGEEFTRENTAVLRAGKLPPGLPPERFDSVLGRRAARSMAAEEPVLDGDLS
jgi:N-acetylneuraminate synthase